MISLQTPRFGV